MWITRKTDYATRAVLVLAVAHDEGAILKLEEIAERAVIPRPFLEQIMTQLRGDGIVRSERGPRGGYRLNHPPEDITLERVVRVFQGPLAPISCATRTNPEHCPMEIGCTLRHTWERVREKTIDILSEATFRILADEAGGRWVADRT